MDETDLLVVITEQGENRNPCEEQRNIFGHSSFPVASELPAPPRPDPEVVANAKRRIFTAEYKLGILAEADAATAQPGAISPYCAAKACTPRTWPPGVASGGPAFSRD